MSIGIDIQDARWRKIRDLESAIKAAVRRTLAHELRLSGRRPAPAYPWGPQPPSRKPSLTLLLAGDDTVQALNARFRRKRKPTNVLSFPAAPNAECYLGDIAIAYGVTAAEAKAAKKRVRDHAVHLAVHGTLHLLGYDHIEDAEAEIMEAREIAILAKLGIATPYRQDP